MEQITKTAQQVEDQMYDATDWVNAGHTAYGSMTYEQGVQASLECLLGICEEPPIEQKFEG